VWELLLEKDQSNIATELQQLFIVLPIIFLLQLAQSEWVWRKQRKLSNKRVGRSITVLFFICFISSHLVYIWADISFYKPITAQKANFPLSYPMTARTFMQKHGLIDTEEYKKRLQENEQYNEVVHYPIEPLKYNSKAKNLNLVLVMVESLRADYVSAETMPELTEYASQNLNFTNHYSSNNDAGSLFGLFYGIPRSYEKSVIAQELQPLILDEMVKQKYKFGLFVGDVTHSAASKRSIFANTESPIELSVDEEDETTLANWSKWVDENSTSPWFSYVELSTLRNYESLDDKNTTGTPEERLKKAYSSASSRIDSLLSTLRQKLESEGLVDNTVVIITSNHGVEFNETKTNSWGADSNYSRYQLNVPFIMHWPSKEAKEFRHKTSHFDLSATLMQDLFGVSSNPQDYSSGKNLLNEKARKWILAGDGSDIALITDGYTTVVDKYGNYKVYDADYKRDKDSKTKLSILMLGLSELKRFYETE
jgi:membrane-anchored protein YejM (alkaline phosphatase superfamily)